jgi:ribose 5-phosphate isomerase
MMRGGRGALGLHPAVRPGAEGSGPFVTENGNLTLDCTVSAALAGRRAARELERVLRGRVC